MEKRSKTLITIFLILLFLSVAYTFYKTVVMEDFEVISTEEEEMIED